MTLAPREEPKAQIIDLMEALKASLGDAEEKPAPRKKPSGRPTRKTKVTKTAAQKKKATRKPPKRAPRKTAVKKKRAVAAGGKKRKTT